MPRILPKTIIGQLVLGTIVSQMLLLAVFMLLAVRHQFQEEKLRARQRIESQALLLARLSEAPIAAHDADVVQDLVEAVRAAPSIHSARITDLHGKTMALADSEPGGLDQFESAELHGPYVYRTFRGENGEQEAFTPVMHDGRAVALVWIEPDVAVLQLNRWAVAKNALLYAGCAVLVNMLLAFVLGRTVTAPLRLLRMGTQQIIQDPESNAGFPLAVTTENEVGELTRSFNAMVRELEEQRAGLHETLALLDSMLGNAPIGFAFFDSKMRFVRLNQHLAEMNGLPLNRHLGRKISDVLPAGISERVQGIVQHVFETGEPEPDVEITGEMESGAKDVSGAVRTWLCGYYPVRTGQEQTRWVGAVVVEITQRKRAEEELRRQRSGVGELGEFGKAG